MSFTPTIPNYVLTHPETEQKVKDLRGLVKFLDYLHGFQQIIESNINNATGDHYQKPTNTG